MELILGIRECDRGVDIMLILPGNGIIEQELNKSNISYKVIKHYNWFYNKTFGDRWKKRSKALFQLWFLRNKWVKLFRNELVIKKHLKYAKEFSPDIIYVNSSLNPTGLMVANRLNIKSVWHHRETLNDDVNGFYLEDKSRFQKFYYSTDLHFFPSQFLSKNYMDKFGKVKSKIVYNSILLDDVNFSENPLHKPLSFGIVGRINEQKSQKAIIELFKTPEVQELNLKLHIIGHGDEEFQEWLRKKNISNIFFHDFLDRREIYRKFNFLICNARYEAFGRTVAEANCVGIPVIVRSSGALPELVKEGYNGYTYRNMNELKSVIKKMAIIEYEDYHEMSRNSVRYSFKNYNYLSIAGEVLRELEIIK
ncbi:glycosyltransferase family 4 protein [Salegentibacter sp. F188]|uniref:Glycosyltransferase family 4 protein n=1 Tax=Autumnicola patrickiae TaxID=3075591 RepID=A0ABU3DX92_9FLAO|nr:glycosyltransferase family 4 protein [Salegentibacter sp. F188]MDT0688336.1 glycosyltransferase family 4 protein [Salegentibacter sp. F188]